MPLVASGRGHKAVVLWIGPALGTATRLVIERVRTASGLPAEVEVGLATAAVVIRWRLALCDEGLELWGEAPTYPVGSGIRVSRSSYGLVPVVLAALASIRGLRDSLWPCVDISRRPQHRLNNSIGCGTPVGFEPFSTGCHKVVAFVTCMGISIQIWLDLDLAISKVVPNCADGVLSYLLCVRSVHLRRLSCV
ncbi:hypothetical protein CRG98_000324 [Punica granatum]|uniref:Uncharacterized protein n=1 Tax=Punica granatum TaxID=22663 RepID=A0A2I0LF74_PUNGR|nr:hypothetical protein CRG98_000324 [Punica granatum]